MKIFHQRQFTFIGKSLLWSLLLYVAMMVAFNWEDIRNTVSGRDTISVVNHIQPGPAAPDGIVPTPAPASIAAHAGIVKSALTILKTIGGIQH